MKKTMILFVFALCAMFASIASAQTTTTFSVSPANPSGWYFWDDQNDSPITVTGMYVDGPATPPMGTGSVYLQSMNSSEKQGFATNAYAGTRLDSITQLSYSSYQPGPTLAIALQFDIKYRPSDVAYGGRLVFEPYQQGGTVGAGWQTWNAYNGVWWTSKTTAAGAGTLECVQATPCSFAKIKSMYPDAIISGRVIFRSGGWTNFTGNIDAFTIGTNDGAGEQVDIYDFNLHSTPTNMDQCKNGGYKNFNPTGGPYKNQGQCVAASNHQ